MKASYAEEDFDRAVTLVAGALRPGTLAERIGIEWDYLAWLALGVAEEIIGPRSEHPHGVSNGAEAFTAGFLIGAYLPERAEEPTSGSTLPHAVEQVRARGRHAVIADFCDLAAVARIENVYTSALVETLDAPEAEKHQLRGPLAALFESGLATGLALGDL